MEFVYTKNGRKICCVYWSDGLNSEYIERRYGVYDELQIWYPKNISDSIYDEWGDGISYIEYQGTWKRPTMTANIFLSDTTDEIMSHFRKNYRYEIRRAMNKDFLSEEFMEDITDNEEKSYIEFYNSFADQKKMHHIEEEKINALVQQKKFEISKCYDVNGALLVEHGYLLDKEDKRVMLFTSSSTLRSDFVDRNLIGRANRMLHYKDMIHFKEKGYLIYDFGGIGDYNEALRQIADFKLGFGGEPESFDASFIIPFYQMKQIDQKLEILNETILRKKVILYGFGNIGAYTRKKIFEKKIEIEAIIDNYKESNDKINFMHDDFLENVMPSDYIILMTLTQKTFETIKTKLRDKGFVQNSNLFTLLY